VRSASAGAAATTAGSAGVRLAAAAAAAAKELPLEPGLHSELEFRPELELELKPGQPALGSQPSPAGGQQAWLRRKT